MFPMGPDRSSADEQRASYISDRYDRLHHATAGIIHGGVDFLAKQACGFASIFSTIGCNEWEDPDERYLAALAFGNSLLKTQMQIDKLLIGGMGIDSNHPTYKNARYYSALTIEVASWAVPCCSIAKGGMKAMQVSSTILNAEKIAGRLAGNELKCASNALIGTKADFIVGTNGVCIPTSRQVLESGFKSAGFSTFKTRSKGAGYILPNGDKVRIMEPAGQAPLRASFTNFNDGPINPFTGKPPQPSSGLDGISRKQFVRENTHIELYP